jgi:hypothetical protein
MRYQPAPVPQHAAALMEFLARELRRISTALSAGFTTLLVRTVTATSTVTASDEVIIVDATAGAVTIALPPVLLNRGRHIRVKKIDATANAVTLNGYDTETIDGSLTLATTTQYARFELVAGTSEWHVL